MNTELMFSTKSNEWETPKEFFNLLDAEFHFTLDPCATDENHKCDKYYTIKDDGLSKSWKGETVFMNPPYGRIISKWIKKAYEESLQDNTTVVCLIPARTDTKFTHLYCSKGEIRFLQGRIKFTNKLISTPKPQPAPFPSMIVIFGKKSKNTISFIKM